MNNYDFNNLRMELENKIKKNNDLIEENQRKMVLSKANQFGSLIINALLFSIGLYGIVILGESFVGAQILLKYFKVSTIEIASITIPVILGTVATLITNRVHNLKKDYKEFSKSKRESEKIEEEIKYAIEIEKAKNNNKVLLESLATLKNNHGLMRFIENKYNLSENAICNNEDELNYEGLTHMADANNHKLDNLSTKKVLIDRFSSIRESNVNILIKAIIGGIFLMLATLVPGMIIKTAIPEITQSFIVPFSALLAGSAITGSYILKKEDMRANIFKNINDKLGSDALPQSSKNPEFERQAVESQIFENIKETASISSLLDEITDTILHANTKNEENIFLADELINNKEDYDLDLNVSDVKKLTLRK